MTAHTKQKKIRVVVCGTSWGRNYLRAIHSYRFKTCALEVVGIIARGSQRSREVSAEFGLPLYRHVSELPEGMADLACVAVGGKAGNAIALDLLKRRIPVLCEHPRNPSFVTKALQYARKFNVAFHIHTHFAEADAAKACIEACKQAGGHRKAVFISAAANSRSLYSLLDIIGRALGTLEPFSLNQPIKYPKTKHQRHERIEFQVARGRIADIPAIFLNRPSLMDDGWDPIDHFLTVGFPTGNVVMLEAVGPVIWHYRPNYFRIDGVTANSPTSIQLMQPLSFKKWDRLRIRILAQAIENLCDEMKSGNGPEYQQPSHLMQITTAWDKLCRALAKT